MRASHYISLALALLIPVTFAHANVVTIRTGQVGGFPGSCPGTDGNFRYWAPQAQCALPILSTPFQTSDFNTACTGPYAAIATAYPGAWTPNLNCDPDARWIASSVDPSCFGASVSVLYCAEFSVDSLCTVADSIRVCWVVDDGLGDPVGNGPNQDGVYINGVSLGSAFSGGNYAVETSAVAYNVPLLPGLNKLQVYQRDLGCAVAGIMLSCTVYTNCGPVAVQEKTWGSIKSMYR